MKGAAALVGHRGDPKGSGSTGCALRAQDATRPGDTRNQAEARHVPGGSMILVRLPWTRAKTPPSETPCDKEKQRPINSEIRRSAEPGLSQSCLPAIPVGREWWRRRGDGGISRCSAQLTTLRDPGNLLQGDAQREVFVSLVNVADSSATKRSGTGASRATAEKRVASSKSRTRGRRTKIRGSRQKGEGGSNGRRR